MSMLTCPHRNDNYMCGPCTFRYNMLALATAFLFLIIIVVGFALYVEWTG